MERITGLDIIKSLAIVGVLVDHAGFTAPLPIFVVGFEMPFFMVVFGITHTISRWDFSIRKYIGDLGRIAIITLPITALFWYTGKLFTETPGDYFVAILVSFVIAFPFLLALYKRDPAIALVVAFLLNIMVELSSPMLPYWLWRICFLRYVFAVMLGIYIGDRLRNGNHEVPGEIAVLGCASAAMLITGAYMALPIRPEWIVHNAMTFGYAALVTCIVVSLGTVECGIVDFVGRYTYEIFLVQMIFFAGIFGIASIPAWLLIPAIIVIGVGYGIVMKGVVGR